MIGIGVTTYKRPHLLEKCLDHIKRFTKSDYKLYVATDTDEDRRGIAKRKNECLYFLQECDYIFLFDDDCYPIQEGWETFIIDAHLKTNEHHFVYTKPPFFDVKCFFFQNGVPLQSFEGSGGVFMFLTKKAIQKVGGFYTEYGVYGYEHVGYSKRIKMSQLTSDWFISLPRMSEFIYALDYEIENHYKENSTLGEAEKLSLSESNYTICMKEDVEIYRPIIYK
jgi:glycosyltransferase involved in cell wall biosynthesis